MTYGIKDVVKDAFMMKIEKAPEAVSKQRMELCQVCPHFGRNKGNTDRIGSEKCTLCGCYMPVKTKLVKASCPANKW